MKKKLFIIVLLSVIAICLCKGQTIDSINFTLPILYPVPNTECHHLIAGDFFNNDGRDDIIAPTNYDAGINDFQNRDYKQNNLGVLQTPVVSTYVHDNWYGITSVMSGQMDENNLLDFGYTEGDSVHIKFQNNFGSLNSQLGYYVGPFVQVGTFGDANNDGKNDIIASLYNQNIFVVLAGDGHGNFLSPVHYSANYSGSVYQDIEIGKINSSQNLVAKITSDDTISIFKINVNWTLDSVMKFSLPIGSIAHSIVIGDNRLVASYELNSFHYIDIWNDLNGTSADSSFIVPGDAGSVKIAHLNCSSRAQIIELANNVVNIVSQNTIFQFPVPSAIVWDHDDITTGDFNGDGKIDIATYDFYTGMYILLNTSSCSGTSVNVADVEIQNIKVFPLLCSEILNVQNVKVGDILTITDITGIVEMRTVLQSKNNVVDISQLPAGNFIINVDDKKNFRIIKQ
ncbi:MAG: hypothetical protein NTZ44_04000 [Candidatus Nomurabacteria bacterium]|nr:hypothetical protein [Candidatus Nomurabacteria bacterium]